MAATSIGKGRLERRTGSYHYRGESISKHGTAPCWLRPQRTLLTPYTRRSDKMCVYLNTKVMDIYTDKGNVEFVLSVHIAEPPS